jgi:hypothetical protein
MSQAEGDAEIRALETVHEALQPLDDEARNRVLEYTLKRLGMRELTAPAAAPVTRPRAAEPESPVSRVKGSSTDIRSLKDEKAPASGIEMVALVAYYLAELAPDDERKETVSSSDLQRYFKQAQYPLPPQMGKTLSNAAAAGYLDSVSRGEYKLNPVGHNLVTQSLPRGAGQAVRRPARRRAQPKKTSAAKRGGTRKTASKNPPKR